MADCLPIHDAGTVKQAEELVKISEKWFKNGKIQALTGGRHKEFETFYHEVLPHLDFNLSRLPNKRELAKLDRHMNKYLSALNKDTGKIGRLFKLPENILSKNPITKKYFDNLIVTSNFYRGQLQDITSDLNLIKLALNKSAGNSTLMSKFTLSNAAAAQKKLQKLQSEYKRLKAEGKKEAAQEYWDTHLSDKALRGKDQQLDAMQKLWELITNPALMRRQNPNQTKLEYGAEIYEAANIWHYGIKKSGVKPVKDRLWKILGSGLKANIDMLKNTGSKYNNVDFQIKKLEKLYFDYFDPKNKDRIIVKDYFPRQVLDIAPTFTRLSDDIHSGYIKQHPKHVSKYMDQMVTSVRENLKVPGNVFERAQDAPSKVSKDVLDILDTYSHNTIRFNYNAHVSKNTVKAIKDLHRLEKSDFDNHLQFLTDYVMDTHSAALGLNHRNSKLNNIARTLTSWQFISKLGLNVRSAARNSTQALQNWVYFGNKGISSAMEALTSDRMKKIINGEMSKHGYEFVNIQEFAMPRELMSNLNINSEGKVVQMEPGNGTKFNNYLENVARISGKPMQWVENNVNRGLTFKIAFMERWNALKNDGVFRDRIEKAQKKGITPEKLDEAIFNARTQQASRYAANMVKELHYLYDAWAKPQVLTKHPVGSVLGQFTTYSINFFEYQRKIAAKGGSAVLARDWADPNVMRMARLGLLYTFVTGLSAITNADWGNLVQNDTWERLKQLDLYLTGDEEEKKRAFFGKDPITATFGGPFVSDVLKIGSLMNFDRMTGEDFTSYKDFYEAHHGRTKDEKIEELVRTLNTQIGRFVYNTGPRMINGTGFMTLVGQELGLYNTPELKKWKDAMLYPLQNYLPDPVSDWFTPEKRTKTKPSNRYSDEELEAIMMVLEQMKR